MATRRGFLKGFLGWVSALALWPLARLQAADSTVAIPLTKVEALGKVGGSKALKIKGRKILLVRDAEDSVRAFCGACTHKKVTVGYRSDEQRIACPEHGSLFDLQGKVLNGPAKKDLCTYEAALDGDRILLTLPEE